MSTFPSSPASPAGQRSPAAGALSRRNLFRRPLPVPEANLEVAPAPDHRARDWPFLRSVVVGDVIAAGLAVGLCLLLAPQASATLGILGVGPLVVALGTLANLYRRDEVLICKTTLDEAPRLTAIAGLTALLIWFSGGLLVTGTLTRPDVLVLWLALASTLLICRRAARSFAARRCPPERCLLVGLPRAQERLSAALAGAGGPAQIVTTVPPRRLLSWDPGEGGTVSSRALTKLVEALDIDRVIVADEETDSGTTMELLRISRSLDVRVTFLPTVLGALGPGLEFDDVHGLPLIGVQRFGLTRGERLSKRCLDLGGTAVGLTVMLPLFAVIAAAIKLDSRGPVFFRQIRVGRDGHAFHILKFRTMCSDAEERKTELRAFNEVNGGLFKMERDPRVTRVGRLLRRTSLDELPQFLNVARGQMSLVGPRPLVVDEDAQIHGWDRRRLQLTPGMTGHWQILGSARVPLQEMVKIDYRYVAGWSLWQDTKILLRTVSYVFRGRGM